MKINEVEIARESLVSQLKAQGFDVTIERRGVKERMWKATNCAKMRVARANSRSGVRLTIASHPGIDETNRYQYFEAKHLNELIAELEVIKAELA